MVLRKIWGKIKRPEQRRSRRRYAAPRLPRVPGAVLAATCFSTDYISDFCELFLSIEAVSSGELIKAHHDQDPSAYNTECVERRLHFCLATKVRRTVVPNVKNPPKIKFNKFVKLKFILMPAAIWQILNMQCMQWPKTEPFWIWWNLHVKLVRPLGLNLFSAGFSLLELLCGQ